MTTTEPIRVTSHVGRDLLAAASNFRTEASAVWEYVVNSLQYVDTRVLPRVQVMVKPRLKVVEIRDNGHGMTAEGLRQFFKMHGENIDRLQGRPGRGKFGTGKSAAFGIGNVLKVDTRRGGLRNMVRIDRAMIEASSGEDIDLDWTIRNERTEFANGTTITIEDIFLPKLKTTPIIEYIERYLQTYRARMPEVAVNEHLCEYREPNVSETHVFHPSSKQAEVIGDVELAVQVSATPLLPNEQGIAITAGLGNLVAIETAGIEVKEFGNYLFGSVDVPALESTDSRMEAYNPTRSLQLNPQHPVVCVLLPFIGSKLEEVRKLQVQKLREAQKTEEARRLTVEARRIAEILNEDFKRVMGRLNDIRSASAKPGGVGAHFGDSSQSGDEDGVWVEGTTIPGVLEVPSGRDAPAVNLARGRPDPGVGREGHPKEHGEAAVDPAGGRGIKTRHPRGGFSVDFRHLGDDSDRSKFDRTSLSILINLDHPVVKSALRGGKVEDVSFRRLAYEIAFTEYSVALGYEMAEQDPDIPADDLLYEVRSTLNRVSVSAAPLYR